MTFNGYVRRVEDFIKYTLRGVKKVEIRIHHGNHDSDQPRFGMMVREMERPGWKPRAIFSDAFHPIPKNQTGTYMSQSLWFAFRAQEYLEGRGIEAKVVVRGVPVTKGGLGDLVEKLGPETKDLEVTQWYFDLMAARNGKA